MKTVGEYYHLHESYLDKAANPNKNPRARKYSENVGLDDKLFD